MYIKRIKAKNFKSFNNIDIELDKFNILIGNNASGKSNFVKLLKFIKNILPDGFEDAVSQAGGIEFFKNFNNQEKPFELTVEFAVNEKYDEDGHPPAKGYLINSIRYDLTMPLQNEIIIEEEKLSILGTCDYNEELPKEILYHKKNGEISISDDDVITDVPNLFPLFYLLKDLNKKDNWRDYNYFNFRDFESFVKNIHFYDFETNACKSPSPAESKKALSENGSNLAKIIESILANEEDKNKFINAISYILDYVDNINATKEINAYTAYNILEKYSNRYLPSGFLSDGTVNIVALIVAMFFQHSAISVFEEPDRGIHPNLIQKLVDLMKEAAYKKQIIITTHNPQVVKYSDKSSLLLISRDKSGYSKITHPLDNQSIKTFLDNEMGLDEIYIDNLLEIANVQ